jgi:hypothetical protein
MFAHFILKNVERIQQEKNELVIVIIDNREYGIRLMPRDPSIVSRLRFLSLFAMAMLAPNLARAADAAGTPTAEEQTALEKYPAYSGSLHVLEVNADNGIHAFFDANDGKIVYLDLSIVRYVPIDPIYLDEPHIKASTDRFQNPVFTKCWPDQKADFHGILNFGDAGFPLPRDAADIEAGCATRVRFDLELIQSVSAFPVAWGDNKAQVFLMGFFSVSKSAQDGGKTLYTLKENQDIPFETRLAYDTHKTTKHAQENLSLPQD